MNKYIERLKNVYLRAVNSPIKKGLKYIILQERDCKEIIHILKDCIEDYEGRITK